MKHRRLPRTKAVCGTTETTHHPGSPALRVCIDIASLIQVARRHVKLSARATRLIEGDFARLLRSPAVRSASRSRNAAPARDADTVLNTQEAADLLGVSRPYIVARIEAGDIPLHQQVGSAARSQVHRRSLASSRTDPTPAGAGTAWR